jgi:hypothetical protein
MSANIIRYFPGGKTVVIGIKPKNALPLLKYTAGNNVCPIQNAQLKKAKDLIVLPICCPPKVCTIYDGGNSLSNFNDLLVDNGSGILLDAGDSYTIFCI